MLRERQGSTVVLEQMKGDGSSVQTGSRLIQSNRRNHGGGRWDEGL